LPDEKHAEAVAKKVYFSAAGAEIKNTALTDYNDRVQINSVDVVMLFDTG